MTQTASALCPVLKIEGPPGSGKTHALAREACRLVVQDGYSLGQIQFLTATHAAKTVLLKAFKREAGLAGLEIGGFQDSQVSLLEDWLFQVLQMLSPETERPRGILPELDARFILQAMLREYLPRGHRLYHAAQQPSLARVFLDVIRQLQVKGISAETVKAQCADMILSDARLAFLADVYAAFDAKINTAGLLCAAQVSSRLLGLLEHSALALQDFQTQYPLVLIDDAQELSPIQQRLFSLLEGALVLAGHDKLSIRSYRGADPEAYARLSAFSGVPVTFLNQQACWRGNEPVLSLLNQFLPTPIWEELSVDRVRLSTMVQTAYWEDPLREAEGLARHILSFMQHARLKPSPLEDVEPAERSPRWRDCVVLLRSSHYKAALLQAFQSFGIPYEDEGWSVGTIRLQHGLFDLFTVLRGWQHQGIAQSHFTDSDALLQQFQHWEGSPESKVRWVAENNRHLLRCLETLLLSEAQRDDLDMLSAITQAQSSEITWLLPVLISPETCPPSVSEATQTLVSAYVQLLSNASLAQVASAVVGALPDVWQDEDEANTVMAEWQWVSQALERLCRQYQDAVGQPLPLPDLLIEFQSLWEEAELMAQKSQPSKLQDVVRIRGVHQVQGADFPLVCIPFLVSGEFPCNRALPELLSPEAQTALGLPAGYQIDELEEARLLAVGMSRACHQLLISGHAQDESGVVLPSPFFTGLVAQKRHLLGAPEGLSLCQALAASPEGASQCAVDYCVHRTLDRALSPQLGSSPAILEAPYIGQSVWAQLPPQDSEPLFAPDEMLTLSASSLKTYMQCLRQFYYKHLLRLPQPSSEAATLGTLIHRVMEVFNRQAKPGAYTAEALQAVVHQLFQFASCPDEFNAAGFKEQDAVVLSKMTPLALFQLRQRLMASIEDLAEKGYFDRYGTMRRVEPERALENVTLPGLERVRFRGSLDAAIELADGSVEILDYKTFRNAYRTGLDKCEAHFQDILIPLPDEQSLSHQERFKSRLSSTYPTDYQLPLYYLACLQAPELSAKLRAVVLQLIRPAFPENPYQGSIRLAIAGECIEACATQLIDELRRFIIEPILTSERFLPNPDRRACSQCAYYGICEAANEDSQSEEGEA